MTKKQVLTIAVLALVLVWSVVMTALGHAAAISTLVPSLALGVQQVVQACSAGAGRAASGVSAPGEREAMEAARDGGSAG